MFNPEVFIALICLIFSYILSIMLANFAQAWLAHKWGAHTHETSSYLSLNPLNHMSIFMLVPIVLWVLNRPPILIRDGVPVSTAYIQGEGRNLKAFFVATASYWAHLFIAFISLLMVTVSFNILLEEKSVDAFTLTNISSIVAFPFSEPLQVLTQNLPTVSSGTILFLFIGFCLVFFNIVFAAISLFFSGAYYFIEQWQRYFYPGEYAPYNYFLIYAALNMILLTVGNPFYPIIKKMMASLVSLITGF